MPFEPSHLLATTSALGAGVAHHAGEFEVGRRDAGAGIDHEQDQVGIADREFGLRAHAGGDRALGGFLESGGIDDQDLMTPDLGVAFLAVAGEARQVGDERGALAGHAVEHGRFSDVGSADDGYGRDSRHSELGLSGRAGRGLDGIHVICRACVLPSLMPEIAGKWKSPGE